MGGGVDLPLSLLDFLGVKIRQMKLDNSVVVLFNHGGQVGTDDLFVMIDKLPFDFIGGRIIDVNGNGIGMSIHHTDVKIGNFFDVGQRIIRVRQTVSF